MVIFVDDLDRCPPDVIVSTLEALNLLLQAEGAPVTAVIGIDSSHVKRALIHEKGPCESDQDAEKYLQKMISLPCAIPPITPDVGQQFAVNTYYDSMEADAMYNFLTILAGHRFVQYEGKKYEVWSAALQTKLDDYRRKYHEENQGGEDSNALQETKHLKERQNEARDMVDMVVESIERQQFLELEKPEKMESSMPKDMEKEVKEESTSTLTLVSSNDLVRDKEAKSTNGTQQSQKPKATKTAEAPLSMPMILLMKKFGNLPADQGRGAKRLSRVCTVAWDLAKLYYTRPEESEYDFTSMEENLVKLLIACNRWPMQMACASLSLEEKIDFEIETALSMHPLKPLSLLSNPEKGLLAMLLKGIKMSHVRGLRMFLLNLDPSMVSQVEERMRAADSSSECRSVHGFSSGRKNESCGFFF